MSKYNSLPEHATIIEDFNDFNDFFSFMIKEIESRQPKYTDGSNALYDLNIFWIIKEKELGYGMAKDWINKKIIFYKFGLEEDWDRFKHVFSLDQY